MQLHPETRPSRLPDLVRDSQLTTRFLGAGSTKHTIYVTPSQSRRRSRVRAEQIWNRERKLGNGTFGEVWLERCASGPTSGSVRAVKEMPKDSSLPMNYLRELEAMAKFSHEKYVHCFVKCFGWYMSESKVFIAMEHLEYGDLQKHIDQRIPEEQAKDIISQLTEGLMYMHDNGFAHRDLKPGNILVHHPSPNWWVKIADFGISKRAEEGNTALRTLIGTEGYLAPEVLGFVFDKASEASGSTAFSYTFAVDMWALGELTFRMITKASAFPNRQDIFNCVVRGYPFPLAVLEAAGASDSCCDFVVKAMAGDPSKRMTAKEASTHDWIRVSRPSSASSSRSSQMMSEVTTATSSASVAKNTDSDSSFQWESTAQWSTGVGSSLVHTAPQQTGTSTGIGQEIHDVLDNQPSSAPTTSQAPWFQATADWTAVPRIETPVPPKASPSTTEEVQTAFVSAKPATPEPSSSTSKENKDAEASPAVAIPKPTAGPGPSVDFPKFPRPLDISWPPLKKATPYPYDFLNYNKGTKAGLRPEISYMSDFKSSAPEFGVPLNVWQPRRFKREQEQQKLEAEKAKSNPSAPAATPSKSPASPESTDDATLKAPLAQKVRRGPKDFEEMVFDSKISEEEVDKLRWKLDGLGPALPKDDKAASSPESATAARKVSSRIRHPSANMDAKSKEKKPDVVVPETAKKEASSGPSAEATAAPNKAPAFDPLLLSYFPTIKKEDSILRTDWKHYDPLASDLTGQKHKPTKRFSKPTVSRDLLGKVAAARKAREEAAKILPNPPKRENPKFEFVTALFTYVAQASGDLSFEKGDIIRVTQRTEIDNDWWRGELRTDKGVFPANYCTPVTVISTTMPSEGEKMPPCFLHKEVKSAYTSKTVAVEFVNRTAIALKTLWIRWDGTAIYYTMILPGKTVQQGTSRNSLSPKVHVV
ncbi:hypothetical protein QQZ08_005260 [Neonectria magnoliae]|uniref:Uncharacterized protein n=1 Tax=Neonectria magnoliae TaxID=2732573 RepID=A0ABR1I590_9HYPO